MHKHYNGLKTLALFLAIIGLLVGVGWALTASSGDTTWIVLFSVIGLATTAWGYWNSDTVAIRAMRARPVSAQEAPDLHAMVAELAAQIGDPMPRLYVSPQDSPNAFATGRNPANAAVCCTEGILRLLSPEELRGVLAHEMMHVHNRDILTASLAAAFANVIVTIGQVLSFGSLYGRRSSGNPLAVLVAALVAPFAAMMIRMAISRTREFDADEDGARLTGQPLALASALQKLAVATARKPMQPTRSLATVSHLMFTNPFGGLEVRRFLATHPPVEERVRRLVLMAAELGQVDPREGLPGG